VLLCSSPPLTSSESSNPAGNRRRGWPESGESNQLSVMTPFETLIWAGVMGTGFCDEHE
jgi:hypothetical protein